jgi:hypothetical protein
MYGKVLKPVQVSGSILLVRNNLVCPVNVGRHYDILAGGIVLVDINLGHGGLEKVNIGFLVNDYHSRNLSL